MEQSAEAIGDNLKRIRESRGLSLDKLSELTEVSKSMLRQIEMGKSSPTISTIWKIANGLRVSFTSLLKKEEAEVEVNSFRDIKTMLSHEGHYRLYPIIPFDPQHPVETYYFEIDPNGSFEGEPHMGEVYEYIFVTAGELTLKVAEKTLVIREGEYVKFKADCRHSYFSSGKDMLKAIMQVAYL